MVTKYVKLKKIDTFKQPCPTKVGASKEKSQGQFIAS